MDRIFTKPTTSALFFRTGKRQFSTVDGEVNVWKEVLGKVAFMMRRDDGYEFSFRLDVRVDERAMRNAFMGMIRTYGQGHKCKLIGLGIPKDDWDAICEKIEFQKTCNRRIIKGIKLEEWYQ